jgi:hypothetical protein
MPSDTSTPVTSALDVSLLDPSIQLPTFLVIGAGKSGTTSLWSYLGQHPDVFVSPVKETNFFALEGQDVPAQDTSAEQMHHYPWSVTRWADYATLFAGAAGHAAVGEVSPMYLYHPEAPARIKARLPHVRLVAVLRQPADRLFSRWQHLVSEGRAPSARFADALDRSSIWWRRPDLVPEGFYGRHVARYLDAFPREQLKVVLFDDLKADLPGVLRDVYAFLGVDPGFVPEVLTPRNVSGRIENPVLRRLVGRESVVRAALERLAPGLLARLREAPRARRALHAVRRRLATRDTLSPALRRRLTREVYGDDLDCLEDVLGRDLSTWRA